MCHMANEWWMRTRSYENECFICFVHPHMSLVTDPKGGVYARRRIRLCQGGRPGLLCSTLDLRECTATMLKVGVPISTDPLWRARCDQKSRRRTGFHALGGSVPELHARWDWCLRSASV